MGKLVAPDPMELVGVALWARRRGHEELFDEIVAALLTAPRGPLSAELTSWLEQQVAVLWERGWQPADLRRVIARELSSQEAALLTAAVVSQSSGYRALGEQVAPRWMAQVDSLGGARARQSSDGGAPWVDVLVPTLRLLHALEQLPDLPLVEPPPSTWHDGMRRATDVDGSDGVLDVVRELLAEAESTDRDAEAESLTATAQELVARHRIERAALVRGSGSSAHDVVARRIGVVDPYAAEKASLLAGVCAANGARSVWTEDVGATTVFGLPADLDVVEELFASLLVQSSRALRREGPKRDRFGRRRTTRFRRAFLQAFAHRVAGRLRAVADATLDADPRRPALLPALAAREAAVERALVTAFPDRSPDGPTRLVAAEVWVAPTLFDDADLGVGDLLERRSAS